MGNVGREDVREERYTYVQSLGRARRGKRDDENRNKVIQRSFGFLNPLFRPYVCYVIVIGQSTTRSPWFWTQGVVCALVRMAETRRESRPVP